MATVYLPKGRNIYRIEFRNQYSKTQKISSGSDDKRIAESLGMKLEEDADRIRVGLVPKHAEITGPYLGLVPMIRGRIKWSEATKTYLTELERQGSGPESKHHRDVRVHLWRWGKDCGWKTIDEATPAAISAFLGRLQEEGRRQGRKTTTWPISASSWPGA